MGSNLDPHYIRIVQLFSDLSPTTLDPDFFGMRFRTQLDPHLSRPSIPTLNSLLGGSVQSRSRGKPTPNSKEGLDHLIDFRVINSTNPEAV
jgi:hypothetical protein